jgi:outer membrane receptor protein involved in Fe transport
MRNAFAYRGSLAALALFLTSLAAYADGRIKFTVRDSESKKPISGALIVLDPAESELSGVQFTADAEGLVTTGELAPGVRGFRARATVDGVVYKELRGRVTILDNQDLEIDIELDRQGIIERKIQEDLLRLDSKTTSNYTFRDRKHFQFYPLGVGNTLSLEKQLRMVPGMAADSLRRTHPRGENNNLALSVEGFLLPPTVVGRSISYILPESVETLKAHVGGFAPSQGSASGAFLETRLRPALSVDEDSSLSETRAWRLAAMAYRTTEASLLLTKQSPKSESGKASGYWVALQRRGTGNALESPQDYEQLAHNNQNETALAGKYELRQSPKTSSSAFFSIHDGKTQIANRTGLDAIYFGAGQGYGYGGLGNEVDFPSSRPGINNSQRVLGNDINQSDAHRLLALQHKTQLGGGTNATFTLGVTGTSAKVTGSVPGALTNMNSLPANSSIEFVPTTKAAFNYTQLQADFVRAGKSAHDIRYGLLLRNQSGSESYRYVPQSQAAVNALRNIGDAAVGAALTSFGASGTAIPTLGIDRDGTYTAAYVQDTYEFKNGLRLNAGLRADNYEQSHNLDLVSRRGRVSFSQVSPRINALYSVAGQNLVVRASMGQLVTLPGTGQGAIALNPVRPQTTDQIDLSVEKQLNLSLFKLSIYDKKSADTIAYRALVVGPQQMAFSTLNAGNATSKGWELSWEYNPHEFSPAPGQLRDPQGLNAFVLLANNRSRFTSGATDVATPQDQGTTLTAGVGYHFDSDFIGSLSVYRGSGLASSALRGQRDAITEVNFKLTSPPNYFFKRYGMELTVENLFDGTGRFNFNSDFAGTRFQQGRRFAVGLYGQF